MPLACARCCNSVMTRSVSVRPGWITLTLTPSFLPSPESPLEKFAIAAFTEPPIRNSASGVRAAPPMMLTTWPSRLLQHRPEQFREPHAGEIFQREAVVERLVGHLEEIAAARRAGIVHQHVAAPELLLHEGVQRLAGLELLQVAREGERLRPANCRSRSRPCRGCACEMPPARSARPRARTRPRSPCRCRGCRR